MRGIEAKGQVNDRILFFKQCRLWKHLIILLLYFLKRSIYISDVFQQWPLKIISYLSRLVVPMQVVHLCLPLGSSVKLACETVVIIIWFVFYIWKWIHLYFSAVSFTVCFPWNSVVLFSLSSLKALLGHEYVSVFGDLKQYGLHKQSIFAL